MLAAEIHRKLSESAPDAQRKEDVLTSYFVSIFQYLSQPHLAQEFLCCAHNLSKEPLCIEELLYIEAICWPKFQLRETNLREADIVLLLEEKSGQKAVIVVECKYLSGLSNLSMGEDHKTADEKDNVSQLGHQLADEFAALMCGTWYGERTTTIQDFVNDKTSQKLLLFITADHEIPTREIQAACEELENKSILKCPDQKSIERDVRSKMFWVGWRKLHKLLEKKTSLSVNDFIKSDANLMNDLKSILELRDLKSFNPYQEMEVVPPYNCIFQKHSVDKIWTNLLTVLPAYKSSFSTKC